MQYAVHDSSMPQQVQYAVHHERARTHTHACMHTGTHTRRDMRIHPHTPVHCLKHQNVYASSRLTRRLPDSLGVLLELDAACRLGTGCTSGSTPRVFDASVLERSLRCWSARAAQGSRGTAVGTLCATVVTVASTTAMLVALQGPTPTATPYAWLCTG